ncbi:MAG: phosphatase PAP2 family protein [Clostridiaceae bacterium]|jgi:membrane-associated phospholipid phosphatase|nr:phosphatase PAP2 family protein [Clostridiaceae bacterium]
MTDKYLISIGILIAIFILLPIFSRPLVPFNLAVRQFVSKHRSMRLRSLMIFTHRYNDFLSFSIQLLFLALLLGLVWRDWRRAGVLLIAMFIQTTIITLFKRLTSIDRPPQLVSHIVMTSGSYPSGHSAASLTFALLVPLVLMPYVSQAVTIILGALLGCVALLTAYGRLYLDVHWFTDVIGGWLLSVAIFLLSIGFLT